MTQSVYTWSTRTKGHKPLAETVLDIIATGEQVTSIVPTVTSNFPGNVSKVLDAIIVTVRWE